MPSPQATLERLSEGVPVASLTADFLEYRRPAGDDPLVLLVTAASASTGQAYATGVRPTVESFQETFLEPEVVHTFAELGALEADDSQLEAVFGAVRKRQVLVESAAVLAARDEASDLAALIGWAAEADYYRYQDDPIGSISGIGPATFQFLRQLAGMDTAAPRPDLVSLLETVANRSSVPWETLNGPPECVAAAEWLSLTTEFRLGAIDRLAWWLGASEADKTALGYTDAVAGDHS